MELKSLSCPSCGGIITVDDGLDVFFCKYCGNRIILSGLSDAAYNAKVEMKKLEVKASEIDHKYQYAHKVLDRDTITKNRKEKTNRRIFTVLVVIPTFMIFLIIFVGLISFFAPGVIDEYHEYQAYRAEVTELEDLKIQIDDCIARGDYDEALALIDGLKLDNRYGLSSYSEAQRWDECRQDLFQQIRTEQRECGNYTFLNAPLDCTECTEYTKREMIEIFEEAGFENIRTEQVRGSAGFFKDSHLVKEVTIDGVTEFTERDTFISDAEIVIYYYEK